MFLCFYLQYLCYLPLDSHLQHKPKADVSHSISVPLLLKSALECAIRQIRGNKLGLKLNGAHRRLPYADGMDLLGDDIIL
jgi:hypothetical protein